MNKNIAARLAVFMIALAFAAGSFMGAVGASHEAAVVTSGQGNAAEARSFTKVLPQDVVDAVVAPQVRDLSSKLGDRVDSAPGAGTESTLFSDSFEDDTLGAWPDDPPWFTEEVNGTDVWAGPESVETGTVGQNPPAPWVTVDGASMLNYWSRDYEDTTVGQNLIAAYHAGDGGYFSTVGGDATCVAQAPPAGGPPGTIYTGFTRGNFGARFNEGTDTNAQTYFGPAAGVSGGQAVDHAFIVMQLYFYSTNAFDVLLYDYATGGTAMEVDMYAGAVYWYPGGTATAVTGATYATNSWHELAIEYWETTKTHRVYWDGTARTTAQAWADNTMNDVDSIVLMGEEPYSTGGANTLIDNFYHFLPPTGGTHDVSVSSTWSATFDAGTKSIYLDQNAYAGAAATATWSFPAPYAWGPVGVDFYMRTSTTTNSNGATFYVKDLYGANAMGVRLSGGNIQYFTAGAWVTLQAYAPTTEYYVGLLMDTSTQRYTSIWIADTEYVLGTPVGAACGGLAEFMVTGTVSTQSEIYFDYVSYWGANTPSILNVSDDFAHTGAQSIRMNERGAQDYSAFIADMTMGVSYNVGRTGFWFRAEQPFGANSVYFVDSTGGSTITIVSLGSDLTGSNNPTPGALAWVYGDGTGAGWITSGGTFTTGVWHHIEIEYDGVAQTFTPYYDGVADAGAPYQFLETGADIGLIAIFGEAPYGPGNFYYDDITFWADTRPMAATNLDVDQFGAPVTLTELFNEGFSTGIADGNWQGDDLGTGTDVTCSEEYWQVVEAGADLTDIKVGAYNTPPATQSVQFIDCDDAWTGQYAIAKYNGGNNWFDLTSFDTAYVSLAAYGEGFAAAEGWRLEVTTNGGTAWTTAIEQLGATAIHGWTTLQYDIPAGSMTNQFGFRINVAGSANGDIGTFDNIILMAASVGAPSTLHNTLNWTLSADDGAGDNDVLGYNIYRKDTSAEPWNATHFIGSVAAGVGTYVDVNRGTADTTYWWYVVRAFDAVGEETNIVAVQEPGIAVDTTPPVANAGPDQNVGQGTLVTFDGSGSSDNVGIVSYSWTFTDGTPQTLTGVAPTYTFNTPGVYAVTLTVADAAANTGVDTMTVTVTNAAPTANAGIDQSGTVNYLATFNGAGSSDPDGTIVSYSWTFTYNAAPQTLTGVSPTFNFQIPGVYTVTLTVTDDDGATGTDTMTVTASYLTHNVDYSAGWNLISFAVNTEGGKPLATVFADEWSNIQAIQYYDAQTGSWKMYERGSPSWMNNLKTADESKGYWVNFIGAGDGQLAVQGKALTTTTVTLRAGWNIVGVPDQHSVAANTVLAGTGFDLLQQFDDMSTYHLVDMLGTNLMAPGSGYWVHVPADTSYVVTY